MMPSTLRSASNFSSCSMPSRNQIKCGYPAAEGSSPETPNDSHSSRCSSQLTCATRSSSVIWRDSNRETSPRTGKKSWQRAQSLFLVKEMSALPWKPEPCLSLFSASNAFAEIQGAFGSVGLRDPAEPFDGGIKYPARMQSRSTNTLSKPQSSGVQPDGGGSRAPAAVVAGSAAGTDAAAAFAVVEDFAAVDAIFVVGAFVDAFAAVGASVAAGTFVAEDAAAAATVFSPPHSVASPSSFSSSATAVGPDKPSTRVLARFSTSSSCSACI
mmetsp:Transcript_29423/g.61820  ORF Transcript_29423/g.61820 Transcript_29423/m.61820 type:complete len:270 (+) Transcript_29423:675-1484(+)